jgi:uracil phosphoribosyltransferase
MFSHKKILNPNIDGEWSKLKKTISRDIAYKAAEVIGCYAAEDMLEFAALNKSDVTRVYVKFRDGLPMASGLSKMLPGVDVIYINTERQGYQNNEVEISPLDAERIEHDESTITWFVDPINARGKTAIEVLRYLHSFIPFEVALLSHIVANRMGIAAVQTQITDFHTEGYMNYAFLSKEINQTNGFLEDALDVIPDLGDKIFGTIGADYPVYQMQENIRNLLGKKAGDVELLKGIIMFLLQRHGSDEYKPDRRVKWATRRWIKEIILWYVKLRDIRINIDIEQHFDAIIDELEKERHAINYRKIAYQRSYARDYYITEDGVKVSSAAYLPILSELGILKTILKDFDFLVHLSADEIHKQVYTCVVA